MLHGGTSEIEIKSISDYLIIEQSWEAVWDGGRREHWTWKKFPIALKSAKGLFAPARERKTGLPNGTISLAIIKLTLANQP